LQMPCNQTPARRTGFGSDTQKLLDGQILKK
jgi:hypothetical protein